MRKSSEMKTKLKGMSRRELEDFICFTFEWNDPDSPDYPESMALVDAELLRRAQRGEDWTLKGILEDWVDLEVPASVPELVPLLKCQDERRSR
jgi:hypothetical protein